MSYINKEELISEIRDHAKRIGSGDFDLYQLAHDHIIRIVSEMPPVDFEDIFILGYRVKDLVVIAERIRKDKVDPQVLRADNEAFLEGYKHARDEFQASIEKSIESIIGDANNCL